MVTRDVYLLEIRFVDPGMPYIRATDRRDTGMDAYLLENALVSYGYSVKVRGIFGPQTESAVKALQASKG